jgi:hypothetical protein
MIGDIAELTEFVLFALYGVFGLEVAARSWAAVLMLLGFHGALLWAAVAIADRILPAVWRALSSAFWSWRGA